MGSPIASQELVFQFATCFTGPPARHVATEAEKARYNCDIRPPAEKHQAQPLTGHQIMIQLSNDKDRVARGGSRTSEAVPSRSFSVNPLFTRLKRLEN